MDSPQKILNTHILNSCFSKKVFATEAEANRTARNIVKLTQSREQERGISTWGKAYQMKSYYCQFCNKFHLTNDKNNNWNGGRAGRADKIKLRKTGKRQVGRENKKR